MATPETINRAVHALFDAWNREIKEDRVFDAYELAIGDLSDEAVMAGVTAAIRTAAEHPPSAGQLRAYCVGRSEQDLQAAAHAAFIRADRAARRGGLSFNPRKLDDPLIMHALGAVGGWRVFCGEANEWQQRNFVAAYINAAGNQQLEHVAKLQHQGKPIGAIKDARSDLARNLRIEGPAE